MKLGKYLTEQRIKMLELTRDGKYIYVGTELEVLKKLHEVCSASAHHCLKYEGYEIKEFGRKYNFDNIHLGVTGDQHNYTLLARDEYNKVVGKIDYSDYQDNIYINIIEVRKDVRRQGIAVMLMKWLLKETKKRYRDLHLGMMSKEGAELKRYLDKIF